MAASCDACKSCGDDCGTCCGAACGGCCGEKA
jgi:hypothetical protein